MFHGTGQAGVVQRGVLYSISGLQDSLGIGAWCWRNSVRPRIEQHIIVLGNKKFVTGDAVIDALTQHK